MYIWHYFFHTFEAHYDIWKLSVSLALNLLKTTGYVMHQQFNLLKPTGYVMNQQFNILKPAGYVMHQ